MHPADTMLCFCSVVAHVVAGAVLAFLNANVPGSVHNDNERRVYVAIQVSPPPPPAVCTNGNSACWTNNDTSASRPLGTNFIVPCEPGSLLEALSGKSLGICIADEHGTDFACMAFI